MVLCSAVNKVCLSQCLRKLLVTLGLAKPFVPAGIRPGIIYQCFVLLTRSFFCPQSIVAKSCSNPLTTALGVGRRTRDDAMPPQMTHESYGEHSWCTIPASASAELVHRDCNVRARTLVLKKLVTLSANSVDADSISYGIETRKSTRVNTAHIITYYKVKVAFVKVMLPTW